ncbi:3-oxoacyl-ACP synthase [Flavobacterium sp.]|uniref:3-oxoacyl-ACP synthase n=1 Tax=Flavobacterium sp. TaxID=239 RepID=UPI003D6C2498
MKRYINLEESNYISNYCVIEENSVFANGQKLFELGNTSFSEFAKAAYKNFEIDYPKFFKMDNLSKLAFLTAEIILRNTTESEKENNIALVFANQSSSLDTDAKYQDSITDKENYFPSPAVFVYTLPNICIGEISIRHNLKSESAFFVFDAFPSEFMQNYAEMLLESGKAEKVVCGWIELYKEKYRSILYSVEKQGKSEHNKETINQIYTNSLWTL